MAKHDIHETAGRPLRRARAWAWAVFWLTAGSSVLYNCYHALVGDHMPWYTGVPEGFVPLVVAIGVLEFSGAWRQNKGLQASAWLVTGGAMAWSALAINSVVHRGWAFGLIADAAALSATYFLLNGPTAAHAAGEVARTISSLTERANAERAAREQEAARHERAVSDLQARAGEALAGLRAELEHNLAAVRGALEDEREARAADQAEAARALGRAVREARAQGKPARTRAPRARQPESAQDDMTNELRALMEFRDNPKLLGARMGGQLADKLGVHPSTGRRLHSRMVEGGRLRLEFAAMAAPLAGDSEERA